MGVNVPSVRRSGDTMRGNLTVNKTGTGARLAAINGADADRGFIAGTETDRVIVGTNSAAYHLDMVIDSNTKQRIDTNFQRHSVLPSGSTLYPAFDCRAWVCFNGTGTVAIRASGNVSSITDHGIGDYTVNFATAMPNANYAINATTGSNGSGWVTTQVNCSGYTSVAPTTSGFKLQTPEGNFASMKDAPYVNVSVFR